MLGTIITVVAALGISRVHLDRWLDRRSPRSTTHQAQIARWVAGRGPDPREALFRDGVPVDQSSSPELSSLA